MIAKPSIAPILLVRFEDTAAQPGRRAHPGKTRDAELSRSAAALARGTRLLAHHRTMVAAFLSLAALTVAHSAGAASYSTTCPDPAGYTTEPAQATAASCAAIAERLELVEADLAASSSAPAADVNLTGDSFAALVDTRNAGYYLVGLLAALIFTFTFWKTIGANT